MAALLVAMVGCNKEPQVESGVDNASKDAVYMSFKVSSVDTKSQTDNDGSNATPDKEVGSAAENKINKIDLILVKLADDGITETTTIVRADDVTASESQTDVYVATFNQKDNGVKLEEANYNVYIYANADANETVNIADDFTEVGADLKAEGGIAEANKFFMTTSSKKIATVSNLAAHTTPAHPLDLGSYEVQRAAARFDIATATENSVFTIVSDNTATTDFDEKVTLTITDVALINRAKSFYDFKRVAAAVNSDPVILGLETSNNWVVDHNWGATKDYHYPLNPAGDSQYPWVSLSALTTADNWTAGTQVENHPTPASEYYVFDYAAENTLKGVDAQKKGVTTGVVFRAKIEGAIVTSAAGAPIYVHGNVLYGTWDKMVETAFAEGSELYALQAAINAVATKGTDGKYTINAGADLAEVGFTRYTADNGVYYTTYYYWNRHNDNLNNDLMGIMEFAVVRNNVYKLAVTSIAKYGHPYNPDPKNPNPDPDPENPEDPDESVNYYFTVSVKVLPWVVRVNHIEF